MVAVVGLGRRKDGDKKDIYAIREKLLDPRAGSILNLKFPQSHPRRRYTIKPMYSLRALVDWFN